MVWVELANRRKAPTVTIRGQNAPVLLVAVGNIPILPLTTLTYPIKPRWVLLISFHLPKYFVADFALNVGEGTKIENEGNLKMSCSSSAGGSTEDLRYQYLFCSCGRKAAVKIVESDKPSKGKLYFVCATRIRGRDGYCC